MGDAVQSELSGEVSFRATGGVLRYRSWPALRRPLLTLALLSALVGVGFVASFALESFFFVVCVEVGLTVAFALYFFPTLVALDGPALHIRHLGIPRTWDLRQLNRMTVLDDVVSRVELGESGPLSPTDTVNGVTIPLPHQTEAKKRVIAHLQHFVGHPDEGSREFTPDLTPL